tara:strand:- start:19 stop:183 length:165 start_codon:yes stop_codon:yes gene_type:complete
MKFFIIIFLITLTNITIAFSQGIDFPTEPVQAPISGLSILVTAGIAMAYKKLKK